jgi:outer membrane protein assembly factor BamB
LDVLVDYPNPIKVIVGAKPTSETDVLSNSTLISPIISSILIEPSGSRYFGDLLGSLINMDTNGGVVWRLDDVGMLSSPPVMSDAGPLYFTANRLSGLGQLCHVSQAGNNLHCISLSQPIIGAPVLDGNYALIVDLYGRALRVNLLTDEVTILSQLPAGKQVRSTPLLTPSNTLVVRTTVNDIYMLDFNTAAGSISWTQTLAGEQE